MAKRIDIRVEMVESVSHEDSQWLQRLNSHLQKELEITSKLEMTENAENIMTGGLAAAIAIAGLSLTALGTALEIIKFYVEQKRSETITITGQGYTHQISGLTKDEAEAIIRDIQSKRLSELIVRVGG